MQRTWWTSNRKFRISIGEIRTCTRPYRINSNPPFTFVDIVIIDVRSFLLMSTRVTTMTGGSTPKQTAKLSETNKNSKFLLKKKIPSVATKKLDTTCD